MTKRTQDRTAKAAPAPKAPAERGPGAPTKYSADVAKLAYEQALLGGRDADIAAALDVSERTLNAWKIAHPDLADALRRGKRLADGKVAASLYKRAAGTDDAPGETQAARYWLNNRQGGFWAERRELSGPGGGPISMETKRAIDPRSLTPEQRDALRAALLVALASQGNLEEDA